jgi:hypothetical protein
MADDFLSMCAGISICVGIMAVDALSMCVGVNAGVSQNRVTRAVKCVLKPSVFINSCCKILCFDRP